MTLARRTSGLTLVELTVALATAAVLCATGWATWEMSWRETVDGRVVSNAHTNVFNAVQTIEQDIMRAEVLQIPDPDNGGVPSLQAKVRVEGVLKRRAYRLVNGKLVVHYKDEGRPAFNAFTGLSSLSFAYNDAPTNSTVLITCASIVDGRTIQMQTVAGKRN